jgi:hypothetical protein
MPIEISAHAHSADAALARLAGLLAAFAAVPEGLPELRELPGGACEARVAATA